jgi:hypothetical protein
MPNENVKENSFDLSLKAATKIYLKLEQILQITQENNEVAKETTHLNFGKFKLAREPKTSFFNLNVDNANYQLFHDGRIQVIPTSANSAFTEGVDLLTYNQSAYILLVSELEKSLSESKKVIEEQTDCTNSSLLETLN